MGDETTPTRRDTGTASVGTQYDDPLMSNAAVPIPPSETLRAVHIPTLLANPGLLMACTVAYQTIVTVPATTEEILRVRDHPSLEAARLMALWSGSALLIAMVGWQEVLTPPPAMPNATPRTPQRFTCEVLDRACPWLRTRVDAWDAAGETESPQTAVFADGEESILIAAAFALEWSTLNAPWTLYETSRLLTGAYQLAWANMAYPLGMSRGRHVQPTTPLAQDTHRAIVTSCARAFAMRIVGDARNIEQTHRRERKPSSYE